MIYLHVCLYTMYMPHSHRGLELDDSELPCECSESNLGSMEEQIFTVGPSPQTAFKSGDGMGSECVAWLVGSSPRMHKAQAGFSLQYSKTKHRGTHLGNSRSSRSSSYVPGQLGVHETVLKRKKSFKHFN